MNVVQDVGPDFPIVRISNPKVVINDLNDLSLLTNVNSLRREVILKAQAIVSLFASPVHLYQGEMVKLSNMYCFEDDSVFIILDTTIAIPSTNGSKVSANSSNMKHNTEIVPSQVLSPNSSTRPTSIVSDSVCIRKIIIKNFKNKLREKLLNTGSGVGKRRSLAISSVTFSTHDAQCANFALLLQLSRSQRTKASE